MVFLAQRSTQNEILDDASIGYEEFAETLSQLSSLNRIVCAYQPTLKAIEVFARTRHAGNPEPLRILDIGFGFALLGS